MPSHSKVIEISADFYFLSELFCKRQNCGPGEAAGVTCFQGGFYCRARGKAAHTWNWEIIKPEHFCFKKLKVFRRVYSCCRWSDEKYFYPGFLGFCCIDNTTNYRLIKFIQPARLGCYWQTVPSQWGGGRLFGSSDESPHENGRNSETKSRRIDPKVPKRILG